MWIKEKPEVCARYLPKGKSKEAKAKTELSELQATLVVSAGVFFYLLL